jgi:membrane protein implicated in regulation of membrane protease activity
MKVWQAVSSRFRRVRPHSRTRRSRVQSAGLDAFAERLPRVYLALAVLLALLGYGYLFAFPAAAVVFLGRAMFYATRWEWYAVTLHVLSTIVCVILSFSLTRVRPAPPDKQLLSENQAPKLFQLIEHVRTSYRAPRLVQVAVDDELDVKLVRTPRGGYPLFFTYSLILGLPALQLLTPLHFKGLLIRRLGQAAGHNHRLLRWLSMWRDVGPALQAACQDWRRAESIVVKLFFFWYAPLYRWWSTPVARLYELHSDKYMMDSINDRDVAELLAAQLIARRYLKERYFPGLLTMARKRPNPPPIAYSGLDRLFNRYWSSVDAKQWLQQAFVSAVRPGDTRPALARRLVEIGHYNPRLPSPLRQAASRVLLQGFLKQALAKQDGLWMRKILPQWRELHQAAKREEQRLRALYERSRKAKLDLSEARELASLVERCYGKAKAVPLYRQLLANNPGDANVSFAAGRFLLSVKDPQGVKALQRAMRLDSRFADPATNLIETYNAAQSSVPHDTGEVDVMPTGGQIIVTEVDDVSELN